MPETNLCGSCEEIKVVDYEGGCGTWFTCSDCRENEGIELEEMGVTF